MSEENVAIVREGFERFAATAEIAPDLATDDFVWDMSNFHGWPEQPVYAELNHDPVTAARIRRIQALKRHTRATPTPRTPAGCDAGSR
jgi:hypothetical protein